MLGNLRFKDCLFQDLIISMFDLSNFSYIKPSIIFEKMVKIARFITSMLSKWFNRLSNWYVSLNTSVSQFKLMDRSISDYLSQKPVLYDP